LYKHKIKIFKKNPLIVYLLYYPIAEKTLKHFIRYYKKFKSGYKHELLICFKGFSNDNKIISYWKNKIRLKYTFYLDKELKNDFDIGSFFRVANDNPGRLILFLNSYAFPNCENWLKIYVDNYEYNSVVGAHGSYASLSSECLSFKYKNLSIYKSIKYGIYHLFFCKLFPNPHIRTSNFLIKANDFLSLKYNKNKFVNKIFTNYFESGRYGMSNQLLKKKFKLLVVNSMNKKFNVDKWNESKTAFLSNQDNLVISDHRTRQFDTLNVNQKKQLSKLNWGVFNL
jgi:hypothetical protein